MFRESNGATRASERIAVDVLERTQDFSALSVKDLLEARDLYHNHLVHRQNVIATAIGRYFRRTKDPEPTRAMAPEQREREERISRGERTFSNSVIRPSSWPCVIVLVSEWVRRSDFGVHGVNARNLVPPALYMPDGRVVPVCVMKVEPRSPAPPPLGRLKWPAVRMGGGFPVLTDVQGQERHASVGCLVTDGYATYALTNRHVIGPAGTPIYTQLRGARVEVGRASNKQLTRIPFTQAYPSFAGNRTFHNVDVGLIEVADLNDWTSQVYGIGEVGELADLSEDNLSLRLIDQPVVAYGAASGKLTGTIKALFYRHKVVAGFEYVSDFLIAPDPGAGPQTLPGDSGTVWHLSANDGSLPRPLAVEWGAQVLSDGEGGRTLNFALATSLSTACRELDVELVRAHNTGAAPFWGVTGHYSIASFAIEAVRTAKLKTLMGANVERISFEVGSIDPDALADAMREAKEQGSFVPLADVPDIVWKQTANVIPGGRDPAPRVGPEHPVHFADIDEPRASDGKTLLQLSLEDPSNVDVAFWQAFYNETGHTQSKERGLLPFRVWQFFDAMVAAARAKQVDRFVCAAGILSHYVGDACQPLHGSRFADGFKDQAEEVPMTHRDGTPGTKTVWPGMGIHSAYESAMIDHKAPDLLAGIAAKLDHLNALPLVTSGHAAAVATIKLMDRSARRVPPEKLTTEYIALGGGKSREVLDALWHTFGKQTIATMADGALVLAMLWDSAWITGNGRLIPQTKLKAISEAKLRALYTRRDFIPSLDLDDIESVLV